MVSVLSADLLQVVVWVTPAGTLDDGGLMQPPYLNFDAALLGPPAGHEMQVRAPPSLHLAEALSSVNPCSATTAHCTPQSEKQRSAAHTRL